MQTAYAHDAGQAWRRLDADLGGPSGDLSGVHFEGEAPAFDTPHRIVAASAAALAATAAGIARRWSAAHPDAPAQTLAVDAVQAACALEPSHFQTQHGYPIPQSSHARELRSGFYRTADDRWFIPSGSYPHLRDATLALLGCPNTAAALAEAIGRWRADDLEQACAEHGVPGVQVRTAAQWRAHPQGAHLLGAPLIAIERIGDAPPRPARPRRRPLDDLRVLDVSHVVAGPAMARALAEHGADVLRISSPAWPDPLPQIIDTGRGKRNAYLDLTRAADAAALCALAADADVFIQSWRPGALDRLGFAADRLAAIRPGIVYVSVSAFGFGGPWADRKGFDQMGQAATGIAASQGAGGKPALVPTRLLNDYLTANLGAAGILAALARRAIEGGSYHVKVSLARTAMWVQDLGAAGRPAHPVDLDALAPRMQQAPSPFGLLSQLAPAAILSHTPGGYALPAAPLGAHAAAWLPR